MTHCLSSKRTSFIRHRLVLVIAFVSVLVGSQIFARIHGRSQTGHATSSSAPAGQWLSGDMHVHDDHSSDGSATRQGTNQEGPGNVSVSDQIGQGVINHLDWMPLTDHRCYDQHYDPLWESANVLLVPGEEANGSPHAIVLGAVDTVVQGGDAPGRPGFAKIQTSIWDAHSQGAVWSQAHPDDGEMNSDDSPNINANVIGEDLVEVWNKASGIEREVKYAEDRWNHGYRFGVAGACDDHFREVWALAGPGLPSTHTFTGQLNERAILQGLRDGRTTINARVGASPFVTIEADADGDGVYEAIGGDEVVAAPGTVVTLRIRAQLGAGATLSLYKSPGKSAGAIQTFMPALPDETFTTTVTAEQGPTWYYVEARGPGELDALNTGDPTNGVVHYASDVRRAITSPIFIESNQTDPVLDMPLPADASVDDGAQQVFGDVGQFSGFPDVTVVGNVTHVVAEQHSSGRTAVLYRRVNRDGTTSQAVDLAPGSDSARFPKIAASGNDVWVAWQDERAGQVPRRPAIYLRHSDDGGSTWQPEINVRQIGGRAEKPAIALASNGQPIVVWQEISAGNPFDVMAQIIGTDAAPANLSRAGKTIQAANPADTRSAIYPASVWPTVAVRADGLIAVAFQDNRTDIDPLWTGHTPLLNSQPGTQVDNWQILVCCRKPNESSWSSLAGVGDDQRADRHPALAFTSDGSLVAAWDSKTLSMAGANLSVRYSVSSDDGVTWSNASTPPAIAENSGVMSQYPKLGNDKDGRVRAVWYDTRSADWRWKIMTAVFNGDTWEDRLLMGRGVNTWPATNGGTIVFASTRNAQRSQRDRTQQIFTIQPNGISPTRIVSRKAHGNAGVFDVDLPLTGNPGIECRSGGANDDYALVFTFANPLANVGGASVTVGAGTAVSSNIDPNDAHNYIVNLNGVTNAQTITVSLTSVTDSAGNFSSAAAGSMRILIGDTNADGSVNSADISQTKSQSGNGVTLTNFREDVNGDGSINSADISLVKSKSGTALP